MEPGKYIAKMIDYGISKPKTEGQAPSVFVKFQIENAGEIYWWGNLGHGTATSKRKPYEITLDTLIETLGMQGKDLTALADGVQSGILNDSRDYELVVEENDYNGKKSMRVRFINLPGAGGIKDRMSKQEVKSMKGFDFTAAIMAKRQELGIKDERPAKASSKAETDLDDILF